MTSYSDFELRMIAAAKAGLAQDKEKARLARMIDGGVDPEEAERRMAQSRSSRAAHLRSISDPQRLEELNHLRRAQSEADRRFAGTSDRLQAERSQACEQRTLDFLRQHGPARAIDVARVVSGDVSAPRSYINPTLYRLASRGLVALTEEGWEIDHGPLKEQILDLLDRSSYSVLELAALIRSDVDKVRLAIDSLVKEDALISTTFASPSGEHVYYSKRSD